MAKTFRPKMTQRLQLVSSTHILQPELENHYCLSYTHACIHTYLNMRMCDRYTYVDKTKEDTKQTISVFTGEEVGGTKEVQLRRK